MFRFAVEQRVVGVEAGCKTKPLACAHPQCRRGVCEDRSVEFICVCTNTSYTGPLCDQGLSHARPHAVKSKLRYLLWPFLHETDSRREALLQFWKR